jgi:hypothetical protein
MTSALATGVNVPSVGAISIPKTMADPNHPTAAKM